MPPKAKTAQQQQLDASKKLYITMQMLARTAQQRGGHIDELEQDLRWILDHWVDVATFVFASPGYASQEYERHGN